jgi:hypothetical protein
VDTPGQIEIFTWSASGAIVTEAFASSFPTVVCYVCDTPRCMKPNVFMSNMLQVALTPPLTKSDAHPLSALLRPMTGVSAVVLRTLRPRRQCRFCTNVNCRSFWRSTK